MHRKRFSVHPKILSSGIFDDDAIGTVCPSDVFGRVVGAATTPGTTSTTGG